MPEPMTIAIIIGVIFCLICMAVMAAGGYYVYTNGTVITEAPITTTIPNTTAPTITTIPITVPPTTKPITLAPVTAAPTVAPTTKPITLAPVTVAPTVAPTTKPITLAPVTAAPTIAATTKPITLAPATIAPTTVAPTTVAQWCSGGTYCNGIPVPQNEGQIGATVCGGGNNQYRCNIVDGGPRWVSAGQTCTTGMKNMCPIATVATTVPIPSTLAAAGVSYLGCYNDKEIRALPTVATDQNLMQCSNSAKASGSKYFGLQFGNAGSGVGQCFYGDASLTLAQTQQYGKNDLGCTAMPLPQGSYMGNAWTNALYQIV